MFSLFSRKNKKSSMSKNSENDIPALAKYMKSGRCRNVMFMLGAGMSTSAGIPDFRSPGTGLYSNLKRLNLPYPEAVFDITYFRDNPVPFYTLANELYPGKFRPTITHSFINLLHKHQLLHTCFTQNIDTLERRAGVPEDKIIEAHGSFADQHCIDCGADFDGDEMKRIVTQQLRNKKVEIPRCECGGLVKPDIVFFGESLPLEFIKSVSNVNLADLIIIIGTSLTVHPFASLAYSTPDKCPRVLINIEKVGNLGSRRNDYIFLGKCDEIIEKLAKELGWWEELVELWEATKDSVENLGALTAEEGEEDAEGETEEIPTPKAREQEEDDDDDEEGTLDVQALAEELAAELEKLLVVSPSEAASDSKPSASTTQQEETPVPTLKVPREEKL